MGEWTQARGALVIRRLTSRQSRAAANGNQDEWKTTSGDLPCARPPRRRPANGDLTAPRLSWPRRCGQALSSSSGVERCSAPRANSAAGPVAMGRVSLASRPADLVSRVGDSLTCSARASRLGRRAATRAARAPPSWRSHAHHPSSDALDRRRARRPAGYGAAARGRAGGDRRAGRRQCVRAAWDWGFGDWEDALGACSHTGNREIAGYLIERARPTIFSAAMLDRSALRSGGSTRWRRPRHGPNW
jgi:hypothetical protein